MRGCPKFYIQAFERRIFDRDKVAAQVLQLVAGVWAMATVAHRKGHGHTRPGVVEDILDRLQGPVRRHAAQAVEPEVLAGGLDSSGDRAMIDRLESTRLSARAITDVTILVSLRGAVQIPDAPGPPSQTPSWPLRAARSPARMSPLRVTLGERLDGPRGARA